MSLTVNQQAVYDKLNGCLQGLVQAQSMCNAGIPIAQGYNAQDAVAKMQACLAAIAPLVSTFTDIINTYSDVKNEG